MKKNFPLQTTPLLLASAMALALTACGGSGSDNNAPTPEQPSTPLTPDNNMQQPDTPSNPQPKQPDSGNASGGSNGGGNAGGGNILPPAQPTPQAPKVDPTFTFQSAAAPKVRETRGSIYLAQGNSAFFLVNAFSNSASVKRIISEIDGESITPNKDNFAYRFLGEQGYTVDQAPKLTIGDNQSAKIVLKQNGKPDIEITLNYHGKRFGYADAQALHYYGKIAKGKEERHLNLAYTAGKMASAGKIDALKSMDEVTYKGPASFRAYDATSDVLGTGTATLTLKPKQEKIASAVLDFSESMGKTYTFNEFSYRSPDTIQRFQNRENGKEIRGYFYGDSAEYIGGVYSVEDGAGAFVTKQQ